MQNSQQALSQRTQFLVGLNLASLEQHLQTLSFNNREYNSTILEIVGEYRRMKQSLEGAQRQNVNQQNNGQAIDFLQQQLDLLKQMINDQNKIEGLTLKQIITNINEHCKNYENLLLLEKQKNQELLLKLLQIQPVSEKILPEGIEQSEFFLQIDQMWNDVYKSSQQLEVTLQSFVSTKTQSNCDFLGSQSTSLEQRTNDLEILRLEFMNILDKARRVKQFLEREHQNQNQDNQKVLSHVTKLITYNEQTIQKSLEFISGLRVELERQTQQTEELLKRNITLQQNIKQVNQQHKKLIDNLHEKLKIANEELNKKQAHQQISSQYKQLDKLSDLSLQIHNNFYQKIETNLSELTISFLRISIQNILGSYFSRNNDLQNKQEVIIEVQRFSTTIKNQENKDMSKILDNAKKIFTVFERFFYSAGNDSKAQCFKKSFINSQRAIELLNQYLVSIKQGVEEFKREHDQLKKLEPNYKA